MKCHPDTPAKNIEGFGIEIERQPGGPIRIRYHLDAPVNGLLLGKPGEPVRTDELWKTTCFELFMQVAGSEGYQEFNFAPSGAWAAYSFSAYREGMVDLPMASAPDMRNEASDSHFALEAAFETYADFADRELSIAVTAVIEEINGTKSYWSLAHPDGAPDFHHRDCFTLRLPAPALP